MIWDWDLGYISGGQSVKRAGSEQKMASDIIEIKRRICVLNWPGGSEKEKWAFIKRKKRERER